jgi:hypothetical protein
MIGLLSGLAYSCVIECGGTLAENRVTCQSVELHARSASGKAEAASAKNGMEIRCCILACGLAEISV